MAGAKPTVRIVRTARPNDDSMLSAFLVEAWKEAGPGALGFTGATDAAIAEIASEGFLKKRLATTAIQMTVAEEGRGIIGFSSVRSLGARDAELSGLVVLEGETGRGVGTRLLRKALETARRRGFSSVRVKTEAANQRAISFYKKSGFTESGKAVEKTGSARAQLLLMTKRLR